MKKQKQGGFSEAWVGSVYIVYGWLGITLSLKYGEAAAIILMCPMAVIMPLVFYVTFAGDYRFRERSNFKITLPSLQFRVRAWPTDLKEYVSKTASKAGTSRASSLIN
jgi:hypothetical protein